MIEGTTSIGSCHSRNEFYLLQVTHRIRRPPMVKPKENIKIVPYVISLLSKQNEIQLKSLRMQLPTGKQTGIQLKLGIVQMLCSLEMEMVLENEIAQFQGHSYQVLQQETLEKIVERGPQLERINKKNNTNQKHQQYPSLSP